MARHKDGDWSLPGPNLENWEQVQVAILMDIRDELKSLNSKMERVSNLLHCSTFTDMPRVLRQVRANTTSIKNAAATNGK